MAFTISQESNTQDSQVLRFLVEDTGIGIAPEHLKDIFLPFQQVTDPQRQVEGTGLGLTITNKLVALMGGKLEVDSTLGEGSRFWFSIPLPLVLQPSIGKTPDRRRIIGIRKGPTSVLVIDDKLENRSVLANLIKPKGFTVQEAANGEEGILMAKRHHPDIIFMDLIMPVMDGLAATSALRAMSEFSSTVIIALSASAFDHSRQESLNVGCNAFLSKPIREQDLLEALEQHANVTWEYATEGSVANRSSQENRAVPTPPPNVLQTLYEMVKKGQILEVRKQIEAIDQMDPQYANFTKELKVYAHTFQMKQLGEFLKPFLGKPK